MDAKRKQKIDELIAKDLELEQEIEEAEALWKSGKIKSADYIKLIETGIAYSNYVLKALS